MAKSSQLQIRVSSAEKAAIRRRARRANLSVSEWVLAQVLPRPRQDFENLVARLARDPSRRSHTLAALADFLGELSPRDLRAATSDPPQALPPGFEGTYLAAMIETCAHRLHQDVPQWVRAVGALETPYFASELRSLRAHLLRASPPAFRRRNIFIDSTVGDRI